MSTPIVQRKPKHYFDTVANANHVTFDDGTVMKRNLPWLQFAEARWEYASLDEISIKIGEWVVVLKGNKLGPLFEAIEEHSLLRVRAMPLFEDDSDKDNDTYVSEILFKVQPSTIKSKPSGQTDFGLGA